MSTNALIVLQFPSSLSKFYQFQRLVWNEWNARICVSVFSYRSFINSLSPLNQRPLPKRFRLLISKFYQFEKQQYTASQNVEFPPSHIEVLSIQEKKKNYQNLLLGFRLLTSKFYQFYQEEFNKPSEPQFPPSHIEVLSIRRCFNQPTIAGRVSAFSHRSFINSSKFTS